jgi:hypothetical protein
MHPLCQAGFALLLSAPLAVVAQSDRPGSVQPAPAETPSPVSPVSPVSPLLLPSPVAPPPVSAAATGGANPSISAVLSGLYTRTSRDPANYSIGGFMLPPGSQAGPGTRGLSLANSELVFASNIDPWISAVAHITLDRNANVEVEEAFISSTTLGRGISVKAGRFFSNIGYLNPQHEHEWDFADSALAYQAMLGTQVGDDGVQVKWIAPTEQFVELSAELGRGRSFPSNETAGNGAGMLTLGAHSGGDIGDSHSWRAGVSMLNGKANNQALVAVDSNGVQRTNVFGGSTRVWIVDGIWKWAPNGNFHNRNFKLQGEYLRSERSGDLTADAASGGQIGAFNQTQSGWYLQGVYQFMPRWRVGLRADRLESGTPSYAFNDGLGFNTGAQPHRESVMLDFSPSEFSRFRLQFAQDRSRPGILDNQIFLQYQVSMGVHGAHRF